VLQGGNELCRIEGFERGKAVSELKVAIEAKAGLVPALTRLINPESQVELQDHLTLEDAGMPSKQALAEGVIQLYVQKLKKVVVADELQIAPGEVTDSELTVLCDSIRDDPPDILVLCGCRRVANISCLMQLSTISHLDISRCNLGGPPGSERWLPPWERKVVALGATGGFHLAGVIKDMRALLSLDTSSNILHVEGTKLLAKALEGNQIMTSLNVSSTDMTYDGGQKYGDMSGVAALADILPGMGAILSVNLLHNCIGVDQAKALASILKEHPTLKSLCGNSGEEMELDMSDKNIGAEGAIMLAPEIAGNGALTKLKFGDLLVVTMTTEMTEANFSGKLRSYEAQIVAAFLPKCT
jgi:hypothetical protein